MTIPFVNLSHFIALTGISLLLSAIFLRLLFLFNVNKTVARSIAFTVFALSFVTISGDSINIYCHGLVNDLSISSIILIGYYLISSEKNSERMTKQIIPVFYLISLSGLFFYPTALGLGAIDPYSWGFINYSASFNSSLIFISLIAILIIFSFIKQYSLLLFSLVLCLAAYQLKLLESRNLWDYLFDPLIFSYALITLTVHLLKSKTKA